MMIAIRVHTGMGTYLTHDALAPLPTCAERTRTERKVIRVSTDG